MLILCMKYAIVFVLTAMSLGCQPNLSVGESCSVSGDGFTRRDPCEHMCIAWEVTCENGNETIPNICAGDLCQPGDCEDGFECVQIDSFEVNSRCMPEQVCR